MGPGHHPLPLSDRYLPFLQYIPRSYRVIPGGVQEPAGDRDVAFSVPAWSSFSSIVPVSPAGWYLPG